MAGDGGGGGGGDSALSGDVDAGYYDNDGMSLSDKTSENAGVMGEGSLNAVQAPGGVVAGILKGLEGAAVGFLTKGPAGAVKGGAEGAISGYKEGGGILNSVVEGISGLFTDDKSNAYRSDLGKAEADEIGGDNNPDIITSSDFQDGGGGEGFSILAGNSGEQVAVKEDKKDEVPSDSAVPNLDKIKAEALDEQKKRKKAMKKALLGTEGILTSAPVFRKSILG